MPLKTFCSQWLYARIATDLPIYREHCNVWRILISYPIRELDLPARNIELYYVRVRTRLCK